MGRILSISLTFLSFNCAPALPVKTTPLPTTSSQARFEVECDALPQCKKEAAYKCGQYEVEQTTERMKKLYDFGYTPYRLRVECLSPRQGTK